MRFDGGGLVQLTESAADASPSWTPDGTHIVFSSDQQLVTIRADGSDRRELSRGREYPAWSSNGQWIAFSGVDASGLYVVGPDGSEPRRVTPEDGEAVYSPAWTRDGRAILYARSTGAGLKIFRIELDGTGIVQLTRDPAFADKRPTVSPDGTRLLLVWTRTDGVLLRPALNIAQSDGADPVPVQVPTLAGAEYYDADWRPALRD